MDAQLAVNQWLRHLGFDSLYSHNDQYRHTGRSDIPDSFSGRTCDSDSHYGGSIPSSGAKAVESLQPRKRIYGQAAQAVRETQQFSESPHRDEARQRWISRAESTWPTE